MFKYFKLCIIKFYRYVSLNLGTHSDRPRRIVHCGETRLGLREFEEHLRFNLLEKFSLSTYDLRNNNCNNFSREVSGLIFNKISLNSHADGGRYWLYCRVVAVKTIFCS